LVIKKKSKKQKKGGGRRKRDIKKSCKHLVITNAKRSGASGGYKRERENGR